MKFNADYFSAAEKVIMDVLQGMRPSLMRSMGNVAFEIKDDATAVTKLDIEVEDALKSALRSLDSSVGFMGEESGQEGSSKDYWLIDPIDGTESFIRGLPVSRNQLAFISDNRPQFALSYRFPTDDLFVAEIDKGTRKNGKQIRISPKPLNRCWIEISLNLLEPEYYEAFKRMRPKISGIMVTRDYLLTVEGIIDGGISSKDGGPWDYVPRALLLSEAGARVGNIGSYEYDLKKQSIVSIHPDNFEALQNLLSLKA